MQVGRKMVQPGTLCFDGAVNGRHIITLTQKNGLYYCNSVTMDIKYRFEDVVFTNDMESESSEIDSDNKTPITSNLQAQR